MKIPSGQIIITRDKLTRYLLVYRPKSDKSKFLARAGFTLDNPEALEDALRQHLEEHEAVEDRQDGFGRFFRVEGQLVGPNEIRLDIVTVWVEMPTRQDTYRFITLKPGREVESES